MNLRLKIFERDSTSTEEINVECYFVVVIAQKLTAMSVKNLFHMTCCREYFNIFVFCNTIFFYECNILSVINKTENKDFLKFILI